MAVNDTRITIITLALVNSPDMDGHSFEMPPAADWIALTTPLAPVAAHSPVMFWA
jgi:hypothetical protein